jgi:hypothetical protein
MQNTTYNRINGLVGISVLALFAIAIIAGQARGDLHNVNSMDADLPTAISLGVLVESQVPAGIEAGYEAIRKFRTTPVMVDFGIEIINLSINEPLHPVEPRTSF